MSSSGGESTRPFSDPAEVQRRVDQTKAEAQTTEAPARQVGPSDTTSTLTVPAGAQSRQQVTNLAHDFADVSLAPPPDARLVLSCPRWQFQDGSQSAAIRLPSNTDGRDLIGVVQRTQDVDFTIQLPVYDMHFRLNCKIYYDPGSDDCVLANLSTEDVFVVDLPPTTNGDLLRCRQSRVVGPGMWRIFLGGGNRAPRRLVDFMILRRNFSVSTGRATAAPAGTAKPKRPNPNQDDGSTKRQKLGQDETEVLLSVAPNPPSRDALITSTKGFGTAPASAATRSQEVARVGGTPLLDLSDGDIAVVRTMSVKVKDGAAATDKMAAYELSRLKHITDTRSARVFTCQHSLLSGNIVTKVSKYEGDPAGNLMSCANSWQREKSYLESLRHPNIISLKAFDGRVFAIYVELLPPSLKRGFHSPFGPGDAREILRDLSSALEYLAEKKIAHDDIKPANIAYSPQRGGVLFDFGIASSTNDGLQLSGTPWYVPPDIYRTRRRGAAGDVWALGVTVLYVLGKVTYPEDTVSGWKISDVLNPQGLALKRMIAWVDIIVANKEKLDRSNAVESLVYRMLDLNGTSRINAAQIVAAFKNIERTVAG